LLLIDWIYVVLMSSTVLIFGEIIKLIRNKIKRPIED